MRDNLQELATIEDFRQKHSLGSSLSRVEGEGLPVLFVEPIHLEKWQDKPTDIVKCEPLDIEKHKAMNVNDFLSDPIIRGKDYEQGLPRLQPVESRLPRVLRHRQRQGGGSGLRHQGLPETGRHPLRGA